MQVFLRKFEALMEREIRCGVWAVFLFVFLALFFAFAFGFLVRQEMAGSTKFGVMSKTALRIVESSEVAKRIYRIHIQGNNVFSVANEHPEEAGRFEGLSGFSGTGIEEERYLLLSRYDGDRKENLVELVDLRDFSTLHVWNPDFDAIRKKIVAQGYKGALEDFNDREGRLRHPLLTRDLTLVFQLSGQLIEFDSSSEFLSGLKIKELGFHHSIEEDGRGNLWMPVRFCPSSLSAEWVGKNCGEEKYQDDGIMLFSPEGEVLFSKSLSEILIENDMLHLLFGVKSYDRDPIHLNDIQPVLEDGPFWKKGDVFLSLRHQSMTMLYRPSNNKILWVDAGHTLYQHDVDILDASRISIFDNNILAVRGGDKPNGFNRMVIYDFARDQYSTYLEEATAREEMRTVTRGRGQILPDGDLWVEETNYGRLLYFKADGALKWHYVNRASDGRLYVLDWSRILYNPEDIKRVRRLLNQIEQKAS